MKIYVDSAQIDEIQAALNLGLCDGVTTNPTLIAKTGKSMEQCIRDICDIVPGPVHAEVLSLKYEDILAEGRQLASISENVVVKIPMMQDALRAVKTFANEGIQTNVTLIFSTSQAILAAKAGATNVCPFVGRLDDISIDGSQLIEDIMDVFSNYPSIDTEVIVASIRDPLHVLNACSSGAHILTIPSKVLTQMARHPLTDKGIEQFLEDAKQFAK